MSIYDTLVVGGGMSGLPLALKASRRGRTAFVEREQLGGTCLNRGCIPTKTMIASAQAVHDIHRARDLGVHVDGDPRVSLPEVVERKNRIVASIRRGSYTAVDGRGDLDLVEGHGRFTGRHTLAVGDDTIEFGRVFLNTGTRDALPGVDGIEATPHLTSRSILELRELPEHLLVVGGGFIGCEFAQMFARFGARVTVVQRAGRLLPDEDPIVSQTVLEAFTEEGIDVLLDTECVAVGGTADAIRVGCQSSENAELTGTHLLIATGRTPNTDDLGLEHLDLGLDDHGFVPVDHHLRTGVEDVWALGDLRGTDMFTHTARDDADVAYRSVFEDDRRATIADRVVPHAVFVDPEVAAVGLTEDRARRAGHDVAIGHREFSGVAKAIAIGRMRGSITIVADATTDRVLGGHIVGPDAGNLVHEIVVAMTAGVSCSELARTVHVHPTLSEGVNSAAGGVHRPSAA